MATECKYCNHVCSFGEDDNVYDVKCPSCDKHFCSLCRSNTHFPATCSERVRWTSKGLPRETDHAELYKWGDEAFDDVQEQILTIIKPWKSNFEAAVLNAHPCIGFAIDEMERMLRIYRWVHAIICFNPHLRSTFEGRLEALLSGYKTIKNYFPEPSYPPEAWRLVDLNAARTTTANVVSDVLSNLLSAKKGGSYCLGVSIAQPAGGFCIGIPDVDESIVPALHVLPENLLADGVVVDARVDWEAIMRRTITLWSTYPSRS